MTREEAIKELSYIADEMPSMECADWKEAISMAIEALKQECIIDKVRAEIEQLRLHKAQFLTNDNKICIDSLEVINILDKYKAECEVLEDGEID